MIPTHDSSTIREAQLGRRAEVPPEITAMATEEGLSADAVHALYLSECERLKRDAKVVTFISILAMRATRIQLPHFAHAR